MIRTGKILSQAERDAPFHLLLDNFIVGADYTDPLVSEAFILSKTNMGRNPASLEVMSGVLEIYKNNGYTIHDYISLLQLLVKHQKDLYPQGYLDINCRRLTTLALKKYYEAIDIEAKKPDSGFLKLPIDWQWSLGAALNDVELKKEERDRFFSCGRLCCYCGNCP